MKPRPPQGDDDDGQHGLHGEEGEKSFYQEVGKLFIREGGKNGGLFLHFLDGEFAVFMQEPKEPAQ